MEKLSSVSRDRLQVNGECKNDEREVPVGRTEQQIKINVEGERDGDIVRLRSIGLFDVTRLELFRLNFLCREIEALLEGGLREAAEVQISVLG
jgi:hypothetical protein